MAYVSVAEWRPEQVTEWLKGLDNSIVSYIHWFSNNEVNGQQLLNLSPDELAHLGVYKLGHQELILEAVQHLRNFHYELDRENLQLLALKLSCAAHSLYSEVKGQPESSSVPTQIMADVANVIHNVKPLVSWLDRPPFAGQVQYAECKSQLLSLSLEMATSAQRDRFAERPVAEIRNCSSKLAHLADSIIQNITDPMILQPATLDLATIKKKVGEDLDFFLLPSFHGIHQIGDMKLSSPAHQSGKIKQGDEIVQVNYQTVVGWSRKKVLALFEESPSDLLLTLKRRPRHVKMYGQIYMKPYRLPSRKRASPYSRWNDSLPSPRLEFLTIPSFETTRAFNLNKKIEIDQNLVLEPSGISSSSDDEFGQANDTQSTPSRRLFFPKPRGPIQRRFTLSGPPRPSAQSEQFWRELQLEKSWRSNQSNSQINNSSAQNVGSSNGNVDEMFQLRDKSASLGNSIASASYRSTACVPFSKDRIEGVKFDLSKFESLKNNSSLNDKTTESIKDKIYNINVKAIATEIESNNNRIVNETDSTNASESNASSISELNKLKRNAFFNNMEAQDESVGKLTKEGNSEKVKRVIENFKLEINKMKKDMSEIEILRSPGKVMELIENFEKKESVNSLNRNKSVETHSAKPVTDFTTSSVNFVTAHQIELNGNESRAQDSGYLTQNKENLIDLPDKPLSFQKKFISAEKGILHERSPSSSSSSSVSSSSSSKIYKKEFLEKKDIFNNLGVETQYPLVKNISTNISTDRNYKKSVESVIGKMKEKSQSVEALDDVTKNRFQDLNAVEDSVNGCRNKLENVRGMVKNETGNHNLPVFSSDGIAQFKPVPAQRKSKMNCDNNSVVNPVNLFPLPPKPRKNLSYKKAPPEPPPRPENRFKNPSLPKKNESCVSEDNNAGRFTSDINGDNDNVSSLTNAPINISPIKVTLPDVQIPSFDPKPSSSNPSPHSKRILKPINLISTAPFLLNPAVSKEEKPKTSGGTFESLKAMLTLGRKPLNINSPRSLRKKNALLAKKRNVSVKEITLPEISGFLFYRNRKGMGMASWTKYYFVLQGTNFYGFKSKDSAKADLFIHLPGFTCAIADEVKSKDFSFKIYHTGTVFYFASDSKENLQQWLDSVNLAISFQDGRGVSETVTYSQTDSDDSDEEAELETCFPTSPKMKKVLGASSLPKPSRSHQNLSFDSKKPQDIQRRFGSLKKLSSKKASIAPNYPSSLETTEIASLDRKYLRFLGQKNSPTPVPTSGFRSYRKMQPSSNASPEEGKLKSISKQTETNVEDLKPLNQPNIREQTRLLKKPLHSSNPSLVHPEMADYRITKERLSEFRRLRNQSGLHEHHGFLSLEQVMQSRQEENFRPTRNRAQDFGGCITLEQFLLRQEEDRQKSNKWQDKLGTSNDSTNFDSAHRHDHEDRSTVGSVALSTQGCAGASSKSMLDHLPPRNVLPDSVNIAVSSPLPVTHTHSANVESSALRKLEDNYEKNNESRIVDEKSKSLRESKIESSNKNSKLLSQDIEYPPPFEAETYNLQHLLKSRQKREFKK